jgi:hypothetical protein
MRRRGGFRTVLTAVLAAILLGSLMMMVTGVGHRCRSVYGHFKLASSHRGTALEGQYRNRQPQEKAEEQASHAVMVPQIKSMHQGTASSGLLACASADLGLVRTLKAVGLYRHSRSVH